MENQDTHAEETPAEGPDTMGNALPSLTKLVQAMIGKREQRECEIARKQVQREVKKAAEQEWMDRHREEDRCR